MFIPRHLECPAIVDWNTPRHLPLEPPTTPSSRALPRATMVHRDLCMGVHLVVSGSPSGIAPSPPSAPVVIVGPTSWWDLYHRSCLLLLHRSSRRELPAPASTAPPGEDPPAPPEVVPRGELPSSGNLRCRRRELAVRQPHRASARPSLSPSRFFLFVSPWLRV